jgi:membrane fusion protein (multidrug efflux system)
MKYIYATLLSTFLLTSCAETETRTLEDVLKNGSIGELRAKKQEIEMTQQLFEAQLVALKEAIVALDTLKKLPLVSTFKTNKQAFKHYLELQGNVQTKQNVLIYPEFAGVLEKVLVAKGEKVQKGQVLALINNGGMTEQLAQLEAKAALSKTTFERQERLWAQKIGSEIQYLQAETAYQADQNAVKHLKSQLAKTNITAPFDGTIDDVIKEEGTVVAPGMNSEVFRIVNLSKMYIETEVPENFIASIRKGKSASVYFPILGKKVTTTVKQVGNFINPSNRSFKIEIDLPNTTGIFKPNLTARVQLNDYTNPNAVLIPQSIISENANGEQYIYTVQQKNKNNEAQAKRTIIVTGKTQGNVIEVLTGLEDGTEIIQEGARSVTDGQTVKVIDAL